MKTRETRPGKENRQQSSRRLPAGRKKVVYEKDDLKWKQSEKRSTKRSDGINEAEKET